MHVGDGANQLNLNNPIRSLYVVNQNQQQEGKHTVNATYVGRLQAMKSNNVCKLCGWTEGRNRITIKQSGKTGPSVLPALH